MRSRSWRLVQARRVATTGLLVQTAQNTFWSSSGAGANCTEDWRFRDAVLGWSLTRPLCANDRCFGVTVQKTVEVPQVQCSDRVVDVPAAVHRRGVDVPANSDAGREKGRILRHFWFIVEIFLEPLMAHSFYCVLSRAGGWR